MDPITLILSALTAGATTNLSTITSVISKSLYKELKTLILRRFTENHEAPTLLADYEDDPEIYEIPLKRVLIKEQIDKDEEIIRAAMKLMKFVQPQQAAMGRYNVHISGNAQSVAQGDYQQVNINFGHQEK